MTIHQGYLAGFLERGAKGVIEYFVGALERVWKKDDELLLVAYDCRELAPLIKGREQAGRAKQVGGSRISFDPQSSKGIPVPEFSAWLRCDEKAARDGVANAIVASVRAATTWRDYEFARWNARGSPGEGRRVA